MMNVLYEAGAEYGVSPTFLVFCCVLVTIIIIVVACWQKIDLGVRIFSSILILFLSFIVVCQIYVAFDARNKIYNEYRLGHYYVAEGEIYNYTCAEDGEDNLPDYFSVSNVNFQVPGFVSCWGYPLKVADGGVLHEGMRVRILYINYKFENVIMRIEIID